MEFVPPKKVFKQPPMGARERHEISSYDIPGFLHPGRTKNGGMVSYFQGHPFPRKGFVYSEGVMATNKIKRATLSLFLPLAYVKNGLLAFTESYLSNYVRLINTLLSDYERMPYLKYEYYTEFNKSVWNFTFLFLRKLGISFLTAYRTGRILATIFENDDAYKVRAQDILNESVKENFLENPRKELLRLLEIFKQRETTFNAGADGAGERIVKMIQMLSYLLVLPPIKRAFKYAIKGVEYEWFKYDEIDYYWTLNRGDYKCNGRDFEERKEEQIRIMIEFAKQNNPGKVVERVEIDGVINIIAK